MTEQVVQAPAWVLLVGQGLFSALIAVVAWSVGSRRYRTARQGREEAMVEALRLANQTLPHLRRGLSPATARRTAALVYDYFRPAAVAIVSPQRLVAFVGAGEDHHQAGPATPPPLVQEALRTGRPAVARRWADLGCAVPSCPVGRAVVAPLRSGTRVLGVVEVFYSPQEPLTAGRVRVVTALAQLMSLQIELAELDRKTEQLAKAELAALQAQISPHFVYNTLNTIASFIRTKPDEARRLLAEFADFTRRSLRRRGEFAAFAQELEYVHQYLGFEKARFGDRLQVTYRVDPEILSTVVPVLVLQPLVENAVRHGVAHKEGPVKVLIRAEDRGNECWITVQDDGVGIPPEVAHRLAGEKPRANGVAGGAHGGLGLANVHERLRSVYGSEYGLHIQGAPGEGTRVSFAVPKFKSGVSV